MVPVEVSLHHEEHNACHQWDLFRHVSQGPTKHQQAQVCWLVLADHRSQTIPGEDCKSQTQIELLDPFVSHLQQQHSVSERVVEGQLERALSL